MNESKNPDDPKNYDFVKFPTLNDIALDNCKADSIRKLLGIALDDHDEFYSKQPLTDQDKEKINRDALAKTRLDIEQYHLKILERRRQAVEKLSGIDLARRLKLYDDYESFFRKMNDLSKQWSGEDTEDFSCKWDSATNEYKSLLQREKLYANVGQQTDQKGQTSGGGKTDLACEQKVKTQGQTQTMPRRFKKADDSYTETMEAATRAGTPLGTDEQIYNWLFDKGCSQYDDNTLPDSETWQRYLRGAREYRMKQQATALKNIPNITR
ncbi:MAG: hypothetical protein WC454_06460 [Phycisphaerae bacterium]|jgi:hypothetical protein